MALNPHLLPNGRPVPFVNEMLVLVREGVEFEVDKIPGAHGGTVKAKGTIFLSIEVATSPVIALLSFPVFLFITSILLSVFLSKKPVKNLPPRPKPWPLVGSLPELLRNKPVFRWVHRLMEEMNTDIVCIRLGNLHVISTSSPKIAREFLKKNDVVFSNRPDCMAAKLTSGGYLGTVLSPMGEQWKKMRKILTLEILSPARHAWTLNKRNEEADRLLQYIYGLCALSDMAGGLVNVRIAGQYYCGNLIRKVFFGKRFFGSKVDGGDKEGEREYINALFVILECVYGFCVSDYLPMLRWTTDLDGHEKMVRKAIECVRKYQDPEIDERYRQWKDGDRNEPDDFLDILITLKDKTSGKPLLSPDEIKAQIIELVIAAVDHPSNAFEWALAEMLNRPHTLKLAVEELDSVVGKTRLVQESDLPNLKYMKACAREAFRLHPVAPFNLPHVSVQETTVAGYFILKGSHVLLSRRGLGRNSEAWDDALAFNPERHLKEHDVVFSDHDLNMLTFSTGRRGCPAVVLGSTMTAMLFARMIQGFTWSIPTTESSVDLTESWDSMFMAKPLVVSAKPRLSRDLYQISG